MGFWDIFRKKKNDEAAADEPDPIAPEVTSVVAPVAPPPPRANPLATQTDKDVARLGRIGMHGGPTPDEALSIFAQLRSTPDEARGVEELVRVRAALAAFRQTGRVHGLPRRERCPRTFFSRSDRRSSIAERSTSRRA